MPLISIDLDRELWKTSGPALAAAVHEAQVEALGIVEDDRFQVFTPHDEDELRFDPAYGGVDRKSLVLIRIVMVHMYSVSTKRALFAAIVEKFGAVGVRPEDILISVVENGFEDWYAGSL
jgi:hypothetical protein